jgi:hypothetical protein
MSDAEAGPVDDNIIDENKIEEAVIDDNLNSDQNN